MQQIKTSIRVREIMDTKFPIADSTTPLMACVRKMNNKHDACLIIRNGNFDGIIGHDEILRGLMYGKDKNTTIDKIKTNKRFVIMEPDADIYTTLVLMKDDDIDFIVVKDKGRFLGLVTKKEIIDIEPELFENTEIAT